MKPRWTGRVAAGVVTFLFLAGLAVAATWLLRGEALPQGPVDLVYDHQTCAYCQMHVSEPAFAAEILTMQGEVLAFDDPGCLLLYLDEQRPQAHAIWFRHARRDRWISRDDVAFVRTDKSPMGFGVAAVERGTPASIPLEEARAVVRARQRAVRKGAP
jgi:hypothetical protein